MGTGQNSFENYLEKFDTICVPSNFIFQTLREHGFDNVELVKHPMALPSLTPEFFNVTGTLKILFYFDYDSYPKRKNPEAAVHALNKPFQTARMFRQQSKLAIQMIKAVKVGWRNKPQMIPE